MFEGLLGGVLSAGANIFGGITSAAGAANANAQNIAMQQQTNQMNMQMFHENQDWQERMSNSAYQRQMADMRAAGLNPMLAYQKGGGAPAPSMSAPTLQAPHAENTESEKGRAIGGSVSSAIDAVRTAGAIENMAEQNKLLTEQTNRTKSETSLNNTNVLKSVAETKLTDEQIKNMPWLQGLLKSQATAAEAAAGASGAAATSSIATAKKTDVERETLSQTGNSIIGNNINSIWRMLQSAIPTPKAPTAGKNASAPGGKSLWDMIKEKLP